DNFSNHEFTVMRLLIVSKLARARQDQEQAARLLGAAESLREQNGYLLEPLPRAEYEETLAQVRAQLGPAAFETAWAEGQAMTEAEVVTAALDYVQALIVVVRLPDGGVRSAPPTGTNHGARFARYHQSVYSRDETRFATGRRDHRLDMREERQPMQD